MLWLTSRAIVLGLLLLSIGCSHNQRRTSCDPYYGQMHTLPSTATADTTRSFNGSQAVTLPQVGIPPLPAGELNINTVDRNLPLAAIPPIPGSAE